jgi:hypothetical protein
MDLVNERDANGNVTKAAPTFDYILAVSLNSMLRQIMQMLRVKDVEPVEARVEEAVQSRE